MKKEIIVIIGVIILLLGISAIVLFAVPQLTISEYVEVYKQDWGHICCEEGAFEPPYVRYANDEPVYECNAYTDECHINLIYIEDITRKFGFASNNACYKINRIKYSKSWGDTTPIIIPYGSKIEFVKCVSLSKDERAYYKYSAKYRKFYIQGVENGKIYTRSSCILDADLKERVLADGLNELSRTGASRCQNYMIGFIKVATKTYSYGGREVICQARQLYDIDSRAFKDGITRKLQGEKVANVECCPHEPNCDEDTFEFIADKIRECTYSSECAQGGDPITQTGKSYTQYKCIDEICVESDPINVECTNNAICVDAYNKPNMVCKNWKCEEDEEWLDTCGDGKCESVIGETATSCPDDCAGRDLECKPYQTIKPARVRIGLFGGKTEIEATCRTAGWIYGLIAGAVVILMIIILVGVSMLRRRRY